MIGATHQLAQFINDTDLDAIPAAVIEQAKQAIVDGVAVTLGGHRRMGEAVLKFVHTCGGRPAATITGTDIRTSTPLAAWSNGTLAHALDYDDLNQSMGGHPTAPVWSAVLAIGEMVGASGRDLLLAYLLGVEAETKLGRVMIHNLYSSGWHPTAVLGTIGAAAAAAKLVGADVSQTRMAIGMAASFAAGLKKNFDTPTKPVHVGQAAQHGVTAALLVRQGWEAADDILETEAGFADLFCGPGTYDFDDMIHRLGNPWEFTTPGVQQKKFPCCGSVHSALQALLDITTDIPVAPEAVREISCWVHPRKTHVLVHPRPATGLEAKFSLEYSLAAALCHGGLTLDLFTDEAIGAPALQALLRRVTVSTDENLPEWGARVRLTHMNGEVRPATCETFPGIEQPADLAAKFHDCADPMLGPTRCDALMDALWHLETLRDIGDLIRLLSSTSEKH